jgi:hypothetical protein
LVPEILNGWLWQSRLSIRTGSARAFSAHGYVDPSYRPPRLPFVSIVGPLSLHVEPERENGKAGQARIRIPGFVVGKPRQPTGTVAAAGGLRLRFDGRASVVLAMAGLPATTFGDPATGPAIALAITTALSSALAVMQFTEDDGSPLTDAVLLAALQSVSVRWSSETRQFAIISDPGTPATEQRSSVEVLPTANDLAPALGLAPFERASEGRQKIHKLPAPRSMTVEMRIDLWAQSQIDMALMFDGLAATAPTRGRLVLRPSLLATDVTDGGTELRLLEQGEPTTTDSLVHLEGGDGLTDRARGIVYASSAGATAEIATSRFTVTGTGQLVGPVLATPLLPDPLSTAQPAPMGYAVAFGFQLAAGAAVNEDYRLLVLRRGATTVCSITLSTVNVNVPGTGQRPFGDLLVEASLVGEGNVVGLASTRWRIPLDALKLGGTLHAVVNAETGGVSLAWNGDVQRLDDPIASPTAPVVRVGVPTLGSDMELAIGGGAGAAFPRAVSISHVHLLREPIGPLDPKLRSSLTSARRLRPGDMIALAGSVDGWHLGDRKSLSLVESVEGSVVKLAKPIGGGGFTRGTTLVYQDECFYFQTAVKRRDDLMNRLYHCSIDYRVSALLEDPTSRASAVLVRETVEELVPMGASRVSGGHPGVRAVDGAN